ncbi:hypothetical protein D6745_00075 [Candidatus Woesearchaeota archaeon]|nr:MAG: hypothetical protein D6745_00075 [Candidatus Woesearchaeota archaeon]
MIDKQKVLDEIRVKGPVLPHQIAKAIGTNILFASAVLSQLSSEKLVKVSHIKVGGSPLYYVSGQEAKLEQYSDRLHEKERKAFSLLKEKKLLYNEDLDPVMKVALSKIKDFSKAITVKFRGKEHLFWKWYSFPTSEARPIIKEVLYKKFGGQNKKQESSSIPEKTIKNTEKILKTKDKEITEDIKDKDIKRITIPEPSSVFLKKALNFFEKNNVSVLDVKTITKNKEFDLIVVVPSPVGSIKFYCKAKDKKKINDSDLSSAFAHGQINNLPVLFVSKGDLTKKAEKMLINEFSGIIYKKL